MQIKQALVVDEPWVSKIIAGEKQWEMRTQANSKEGWFGLIRKGSGLIVALIEINKSSGPFTREQLHANFDKHKISPELINQEGYKWFHAWHITGVKKLEPPIRYRHPSGAVIWVNLDDGVAQAIQAQWSLVEGESSCVAAEVERELHKPFGEPFSSEPISPCASEKVYEEREASSTISIVLTQGNINNNHFYIPRGMEFFPVAMWGGNNKSKLGMTGVFHFRGIEEPVVTDIDGSKRILRSRGHIGDFFRLHELSAGDEVVLSRNSDLSFTVGFNKLSTAR